MSIKLESQAMSTGQETIAEVATGLAVFDIVGFADIGQTSAWHYSSNISYLAITVRPRAGSQDVDLNTVFVELSDTSYKVVFDYNDGTSKNWWDQDSMGVDNIFRRLVFPKSNHELGIMVLEDADSSCSESNPVINRGDKVMLCINLTNAFNDSWHQGFVERTAVWGQVVPEVGSPGVIAFRTPAAYNDYVMDLQ
jgi:flagellin FlaB